MSLKVGIVGAAGYAALLAAARVRGGRCGQPGRDSGGCFGLAQANHSRLEWVPDRQCVI